MTKTPTLNKGMWLCYGVLACAASPSFADCIAPRWVAPAPVTAETRPVIRWSAAAGATGYVLKVQSRLPEGRVIASFDVTVADTQFTPPAALADERAKVSVSIAARCAGAVSPAVSAWFSIDATAACPSASAVQFRREGGQGHADWAPGAGVTLYEVRLHAPLDGGVLKVIETREPRVVLGGDLPDGAVLSVRPRCGQVAGMSALGFVTN